MLLLVVYDGLLALLISIQFLPDLLSQEYISVLKPFALQLSVAVLPTGISLSSGSLEIDGGPVKY